MSKGWHIVQKKEKRIPLYCKGLLKREISLPTGGVFFFLLFQEGGVLIIFHVVLMKPLILNIYKSGTEHAGLGPDQARFFRVAEGVLMRCLP